MPLKYDADEFDIALRQMRQPKSVANSIPKSGPARVANAQNQSEALKVRVIAARAKLKLMRDRSEALQDSLQRFRQQQDSVGRVRSA